MAPTPRTFPQTCRLILSLAVASALSARAAAAPAAPRGLDALSDDAVRIELANDGMKTLLERAFVVDQIPPTSAPPNWRWWRSRS